MAYTLAVLGFSKPKKLSSLSKNLLGAHISHEQLTEHN